MITATRQSKKIAVKPLTPDEFKAEVNRKGWTYRALAERWEVSENYISKIARKENRSLKWDDAVRGLPQLMTR